jgi:dTDP-D-glucose 4,6-dehydratase
MSDCAVLANITIGSPDYYSDLITAYGHDGTVEYDEWINYIEDRPFNDKRYYISNQKLKDIGWEIKKNFEIGLEELVIDLKKNI